MTDASIQFKSPHHHADGAVENIVLPETEERTELSEAADSVRRAELVQLRREAAASIVKLIIGSAQSTPDQRNTRALIFAHMLKLRSCKTQSDLARQLSITPGRVSQIIKEIERDLFR